MPDMLGAAGEAARPQQFAMHMDHLGRAGALMQIVDVLGHQHDLGQPALQPGQRQMGGMRRDLAGEKLLPPRIVIAMDPHGIAGEGFGGGDLVDGHGGPGAVGVAVGVEPGLLGDAGTRQDDDHARFSSRLSS